MKAFLLILATGTLQAQSLSDQLEARQKEFTDKAPPEKIQSYQAGIDAVASSGIYDSVKVAGDKAPDFTLKDAQGQEVHLAELLKKGPVVLTWYRGGWCPYCNLALAAFQKELPAIQEQGATLVAISPELPEYALDTTEKGKLSFEVVSDPGNKVARDYGLVFKMAPDVAKAMRDGPQTHVRNGDESDELPLSATYVIAPDGEITYSFVDADYRKRAEPSRVVDALEAIKSGPSPTHALKTFWEGVWNPPYNVDLVDRLLTEDFVLTSSGNDLNGRDTFKSWITDFHAKATDMRVEELETFTSDDGNRVVSRWKASGRNNGLIKDMAQGEPFSFTGIAIWEFRDGKLAHNWVERSTPIQVAE